MDGVPSQAREHILQFWGKARPAIAAQSNFHPLIYHSLDVAAVGAELIARDARVRRLSNVAGSDIESLRSTLPFLFALHDIGKYARAFQAKAPEHWPVAMLGTLRPVASTQNHVATGFGMLCALSERGTARHHFDAVLPGWMASDRKILFRAIAGHHGAPPKEVAHGAALGLDRQDVCAHCMAAAEAHIGAVHALLRPAALPFRCERGLTVLAVGLSGLFVLADWIGSSEPWFPYSTPIEDDPSFALYWARAQAQAREAVAQAHLAPSPVRSFAGLPALFAERVQTLSPIQAFAETTPLPESSTLVIIEDVTGSGKTEAAITLAHRLMAGGRANGLYVALPTEATANAMYVRLAESFRRLFVETAKPSLVLAHARRAFHDGFQDSIVAAAADEHAANGARASRDEPRPSSAECAAWIADDRRKAFLAEIGAGTIDQALLAVLPVKHQSLRLWGLADRVLVIDEAHAYDAYMTRELETLLEFHAALGGSAVILSATLPQEARARLAQAFRNGTHAGKAKQVALEATAYPLVTIVGAETASETPQPIREGLARFVAATRVDDLDAALVRIADAANAGACVAFVRNSVDEAIAACERLEASGLSPLLFHARFAMWDRQRIEQDVMERFGRYSTPEMRRGKVLVATQVIEQSLDLDFDLMVTDLAPIDLMIQRAGRLWRHPRDPRPIAGAELVVLANDPEGDVDKAWAERAIGRGAHVYPDHAMLWRSARALFRAGGIATPDGVRALVEAVYDEETREEAPPALQPSETRRQGEDYGARATADLNVLSLRTGYQFSGGAWDTDIRTPTRLSDDSMRIRLGKLVDGVVQPWAKADSPQRAWALSEVSVRRNRIAQQDDSDPVIAAMVAAAKAKWPEYEQEIPLIVLLGKDETWTGSGRRENGDMVHLQYAVRRGLSFASDA